MNFDGRPRKLVALGGLLTVVAPFLTWERVFLLGSLDLFNLVSASNASPLWAWILPVAGGVAIFVAGTATDLGTVKTTGIALGLIFALYDVSLWTALTRSVKESGGFAQIGGGPLVGFAGAALMFVGGVLDTSVQIHLPHFSIPRPKLHRPRVFRGRSAETLRRSVVGVAVLAVAVGSVIGILRLASCSGNSRTVTVGRPAGNQQPSQQPDLRH